MRARALRHSDDRLSRAARRPGHERLGGERVPPERTARAVQGRGPPFGPRPARHGVRQVRDAPPAADHEGHGRERAAHEPQLSCARGARPLRRDGHPRVGRGVRQVGRHGGAASRPEPGGVRGAQPPAVRAARPQPSVRRHLVDVERDRHARLQGQELRRRPHEGALHVLPRADAPGGHHASGRQRQHLLDERAEVPQREHVRRPRHHRLELRRLLPPREGEVPREADRLLRISIRREFLWILPGGAAEGEARLRAERIPDGRLRLQRNA